MSRFCKKTSNTHRPVFLLNKLTQLVLLFAASLPQLTRANNNEKVQFNNAFLRSAVDVSAFSQGNPVTEGEHTVDLYLNDKWKGHTSIHFAKTDPKSSVAQPCVDVKLIAMLGIDTAHLQQDALKQLQEGGGCMPMSRLANALSANYDVATQRLNVQAPQLYLLRNARGYVSPALWDNGIPAGTLQYDYNAWHSETANSSSLSAQYLGLRSGINWDVWRLRYRGAFNWSEGKGWGYNNAHAYLERAIVQLRSKLVMGEATTDGQVLDSVGFRGVMLSSDDRMYEDSQRGYAPVINGNANTNALIRVTQRGVRIYETTVPPGPFVIDDLYPTGAGGDLLVTIKESDGSERSFTVTYASITELLRPGITRYTLMGGRYHNSTVNEEPEIMLGTLRHGFTNLVTGYTGVLGSENYQTVAGGIALNTSVGAISSDLTHARTTLGNGIKREGQSARVSFAKILPVVNTNVTIASYRYSSSGYYDIDSAMIMRSGQWGRYGWYPDSVNRKNRLQLSLSQTISDTSGSISVSASTQNYWSRSGSDTEYQLGYTNAFRHFNLNINASRTRDPINDKWDSKIAIGISLPLGNSAQTLYLNSTYVQERDHHGLQNSIAGSAGDERQYSYNAFANVDRYGSNGTKSTAGISGNWTSPWTTMGGSFSAGDGYQQSGVHLSGGAIAYGNGVVMAPVMGKTVAIIEADHAGGAKVTNSSNLSLDSNGKAVVPYLTPYRQNTIELDPKGLSSDVALNFTSQNSVPTAGAVILMKYKTDIGHSVLFNITHPGEELPFAAPLLDENNETVGYIGQGGQSFARVKSERGSLSVRWGNGMQCRFAYQLSATTPATDNAVLPQRNVACQ